MRQLQVGEYHNGLILKIKNWMPAGRAKSDAMRVVDSTGRGAAGVRP
jgi:hypothetical protein